jgi:hypothetical protein
VDIRLRVVNLLSTSVVIPVRPYPSQFPIEK